MHHTPAIYVLWVAGALEARWAAWSAKLTMTVVADGTTALADAAPDLLAVTGAMHSGVVLIALIIMAATVMIQTRRGE